MLLALTILLFDVFQLIGMEVIRQVTYNNEDGLLEAEMQYYKNSQLWQLDYPHWYWIEGHQADEWLGE